MSPDALLRTTPFGPPAASGPWRVVATVLAAWFVLVFLLGAGGAFVTPPGELPIAIGIGVSAPVALFLAGFSLSRPFREFVLSIDLRLMLGIQAWRFAGLGFLALYAHEVLPGSFAWPAGLGDVAIGVTAPWMLVALTRKPGFAGSRTFVSWNLLGLLDLVVAVGIGVFDSAVATGAVGEATTGPMAQLPLVLIPAYFVPIFVMLHLGALMQARRRDRQAFS
jgi:hypothetical protein